VNSYVLVQETVALQTDRNEADKSAEDPGTDKLEVVENGAGSHQGTKRLVKEVALQNDMDHERHDVTQDQIRHPDTGRSVQNLVASRLIVVFDPGLAFLGRNCSTY
jgi:hypothetical protein